MLSKSACVLLTVALAALSVEAQMNSIYLFNGTDSSGFGYKVNGDSWSLDSATGKLSNHRDLPNKFSNTYVADSGATVCGNGRYWISIQTNAPLAAALVVADVSANGTHSVNTIQTGGLSTEAATSLLFHSVSCDPQSDERVYGFTNNPWGGDGVDYSIVLYNWKTQSVERTFKAFTLKTGAAIEDTIFSFDTKRQTAFWMGMATNSNNENSGTINAVDLQSGATTTYTLSGIVPYQLFTPVTGASAGYGIAQSLSGDKVTGVWYGKYTWSGSQASFTKIAQFPDLSQTYSQGTPYALCNGNIVAISFVMDSSSAAYNVLSVLSTKDASILDQVKVPRGATNEMRSMGGLAAACGENYYRF